MVRPSLWLLLVCPGVGHAGVVINEVLPNPSDSDAGHEYVELFNNTTSPINISGWKIEAGTSKYSEKVVIPGATTLAAGAYYVIGESLVVDADLVATSLAMGNASSSGDAVRLVDGSGVAMDTLVYGPNNTDGFLDDQGSVAGPAPKPQEGRALGRLPNGSDSDESSVDFAVLDALSPGMSNEPPAPECDRADAADGLVINEFLPDPDGSDAGFEWVELHNGVGAPVDVSGWRLESGSSSYATSALINAGTTMLAGDYLLIGGDAVPGWEVALTGQLGNATTSADAVRILDCVGTPVDTVVYGQSNPDGWLDDSGSLATSLGPKPSSAKSLARRVNGVDTDASADDFVLQPIVTPGSENPGQPECSVGTVLINELLANPEGADAGLEWIELYNPGSDPVDVEGWVIDASTGSFGGGQVLEANEVAAGGFLLVGQPDVVDADALLTETLGNATSNADGVQLRDCDGEVVDTVIYGPVNEDGWVDDTGSTATSLAPTATEGASLARLQDGYDFDQSALDFVVEGAPTPGASNPAREPIVCVPATGPSVLINEAMVNPDGDDLGFEWIELYNPTGQAVSVAGWGLGSVSGADDQNTADAVIPGGVMVPANGFLVLGGDQVAEADVQVPLSLGNGSGGDGLVLFDCEGLRVDGVVYGPDNEDGVLDDAGAVVEPYIMTVSAGSSLARAEDGVDSDEAGDWFSDSTPTPGLTNLTTVGTVDGPKGGCGNDDPADPRAPKSGCGRDATPPPAAAFALVLGLAAYRRRRRY